MNSTATIWTSIVFSGIVSTLIGIIFQHFYKKEQMKFLEKIQWEAKAKEREEKVAEYLAIALFLKEESSKEDYTRANSLLWELSMWLPEDIYKKMFEAVTCKDKNPTEKVFNTINAIRKNLLKEKAGNLSINDMLAHLPGAGKNNPN